MCQRQTPDAAAPSRLTVRYGGILQGNTHETRKRLPPSQNDSLFHPWQLNCVWRMGQRRDLTRVSKRLATDSSGEIVPLFDFLLSPSMFEIRGKDFPFQLMT
jgi:hypothetical protein